MNPTKQSAVGHFEALAVLWLLLFFSGSVGQVSAGESFPRPHGIYVLDSMVGTTNINGVSMRDANMRTNDFVSGYALRVDWSTMEPTQGQYDFTIIDWNVRRLAATGQKLSLLFINTDPAWVAETAGVTNWYDASIARNRAVPWDAFLLARFTIFLTALAEHTIDGVKFRNHPVLAVVNTGLAGAKLAIRDPTPVYLKDMTGYSRASLTDAVLRNLRATVTNFPAQFVQIGFWPVADNQSVPALWEDLRQAILAEFDGVARPRVGFWMENLSASRPAAGQDPVSGRPATGFGAPLYLSQTNTWANFQALTSWSQPFTGVANVTNGTPADGMFYASTTYGSTYFELYVTDIDHSGYHADFEMWHARLFPPQQLAVIPESPGAVQVQWPSWAGGVYQMERSADMLVWSNAGPSVMATTNLTTWTDNPVSPIQVYRLRTLP